MNEKTLENLLGGFVILVNEWKILNSKILSPSFHFDTNIILTILHFKLNAMLQSETQFSGEQIFVVWNLPKK